MIFASVIEGIGITMMGFLLIYFIYLMLTYDNPIKFVTIKYLLFKHNVSTKLEVDHLRINTVSIRVNKFYKRKYIGESVMNSDLVDVNDINKENKDKYLKTLFPNDNDGKLVVVKANILFGSRYVSRNDLDCIYTVLPERILYRMLSSSNPDKAERYTITFFDVDVLKLHNKKIGENVWIVYNVFEHNIYNLYKIFKKYYRFIQWFKNLNDYRLEWSNVDNVYKETKCDLQQKRQEDFVKWQRKLIDYGSLLCGYFNDMLINGNTIQVPSVQKPLLRDEPEDKVIIGDDSPFNFSTVEKKLSKATKKNKGDKKSSETRKPAINLSEKTKNNYKYIEIASTVEQIELSLEKGKVFTKGLKHEEWNNIILPEIKMLLEEYEYLNDKQLDILRNMTTQILASIKPKELTDITQMEINASIESLEKYLELRIYDHDIFGNKVDE